MTIKRLNYFHHQFLQVGEFQDEQSYHRDMRLRHNLSQHGAGIVEGLQVTGSSQTVTLGQGLAIDRQGREIVIDSDTPITIPNRPSASFYMVIAYRDDSENDSYKSTQAGMTDKYTRVVETYEISWPSGAPGTGENKLILARLTTDAGGNIVGVPDLSPRTEAAGKLGEGAGAGELKFRLKDRVPAEWPGIRAAERSPAVDGVQNLDVEANKTSFSGDVEIVGTLHVSTIEKQTELRIDDNIITVNTYPPQPTPRNVNGGLEVYRGGTAPNAQIVWNEALDRWQAGDAGSRDNIALAGEVASHFHPTTGHRHSGAAGDGPKVAHADLNNILAVAPASADGAQDKHLSNAQAKVWQDHVNLTAGNPHNTTAAMIGALPAADYGFKNSAVAGVVFNQTNANGATQTITTNFRTQFVWLAGAVNAVLGGRWFGTSVSGYADLRQSLVQRCSGAAIARLAVVPYWEIMAQNAFALCWARFTDATVSPNRNETMSVAVTAVTGTDLSLRLSRSTTTGLGQLPQFTVTLQLICFG
ncbi:MAG: hypothetical protein JSW39_01365 [Desulfobacterales bacterium]|nr:MAG: hypothetical protein JSW39_01365 [Desulfobacterales bacterium]